MNYHRWLHLTLLLSGAMAFTGGCSGESKPEVVIYVAVDRRQAEPILARFEAQSGVRVRALYDAEAAKTTGLVSRLLAEAERPRCDVFWNNELVQTLLLADRGTLDEYHSPAAEDIPAEFKDPHGQWTGVATRARVIVYNTRYVTAAEAPRRLEDLALPQWRGKLAVANPQFGTTRTHLAALYAALGPQPAQAWLQSLLDNEVRIVDGNAMVKNLVARAHPQASPVFVGLTDTDDVLAGQADGEPVALIYPDQDALGTLVIPSTVCLVRGAPHAAEARRLVDFLIGVEAGQMLCVAGSGYRPVRPSAQETGVGEPTTIKGFEFTPAQLFEHLEPSSRWAQEHFHP